MMRKTPFLSLVLLVASCGGGGETASTEGGGETTAGGEQQTAAADQNIPWESRTDRQKGQFMNEVVLPTMKQLFQEFDPQEFAEFNCQTCHGANAREVHFHMPNTLHPLNPAAMPRHDSPDPDVARWATFMEERVKPKMIELLGVPGYDPATNQGFGCFGCHAMQTGDAAAAPAP